jgi:fluoride exporter
MDLRQFLLVCAGGALGSGARYAVSVGMLAWLGPAFPWGTLLVNVVGSFVLGAIITLASAGHLSTDARLALGTGVMGGFTTFSTFSWETWRFVELQAWAQAGAYVAATLVTCFVGTGLGVVTARLAMP